MPGITGRFASGRCSGKSIHGVISMENQVYDPTRRQRRGKGVTKNNQRWRVPVERKHEKGENGIHKVLGFEQKGG